MYVCNCGGVINMFGGPGSYIAHCLKCQSKGIGSTNGSRGQGDEDGG